MLVVPLIERKRDGRALTPEEWSALVAAYTDGRVPDYQMSALLMAVLLRGLERQELAALTDAMLASGQRLAFDAWPTPRVDKHSTGGVGDKVSLVLAPLVAACGVAVPMMSGRGLGHTGGTLDKLEAIPGFRTGLSLAEAKAQVMKLGCAMIGQTPEIAPADRRIYALRDVTGTVEAIPLIAASIMSKKLAEGLNALVLDVKRGSGAFLPRLEQSLELARTMIALGEDRSCPTVALLTAMDRPLGRACGNALETEEAILALRGEGPEDLLEVTYALGAEMLLAAGIEKTSKKARQRLANALASGLAAEKFEQVIEAQGGNPKAVEDPSVLPQAQEVEVYAAPRTGVVAKVEPKTIGRAIVAMGGGRRTVEDEVDPTVGFVITVKPGDKVLAGEPIASVFARDPGGMKLGFEALQQAIVVGDKLPEKPLPLISHRLTKHGVEELKR
ncbi:MAG: thymidine phosphorylase [Gemmatimonadetes bacterium 13_1_40CM_4_69_8]|nr:MAG: thymidine phosphorylase [Gemmatimonadetes bacterium 13_1_40CM_69_22]OLC70896.1 MAG: thymidine phosphorylase [Gemmatimonadetes bacterium 13_1_40CM_4_69_8]